VARRRALLAVDELVAGLVDGLSSTGMLEHTYIVFTSDNGYHLGEHRISEGKGTPYEEAIRIPLVIRGPGVPAGQTIPDLVSQVDLAPTIAAWTGAPIPDFVDGRSLVPLLSGEPGPRQVVPVQHYVERSKRSREQPGFYALRTNGYTYVEHFTEERELYDLARDPWQLTNLAPGAEPAVLDALSLRLAGLHGCAGASCLALESRPVPALFAD
jgi:arylsulfatase A-like enzyme